ncbi:hypothetical protein ACWIGI_11365 [Nocardia sp. NPDC055321]
MSTIAFFVAPDDRTAAAIRSRGPGTDFPVFECHDFDADDAVVEWELYFEASAAEPIPLEQYYQRPWPIWVAEIVNDGTGVFVLPGSLTANFAVAGSEDLGSVARLWTARLRQTGGGDLPAESPLSIVRGVARLAAVAVGAGERVYCRHF